MLDLVRLSPRRLFPPGGVELYRQIALLTEMSSSDEVLDVASGKGVPLGYFVAEFGVTASGVEIDPEMVDEAESWSRDQGLGDRLQFQTGRSDALPYRDEIFDVAIGELGLAGQCSAADAVRELVRVTKPGGFVVLVQLVWKAPVDEERRAVLSEYLGARPMMVVEWKRLLKDAGVEDIHVEDWSDEETSFRPAVVKPFPDFAELFSLGERMAILRRAWQRWGWRGVSSAIARENEVHKLLTNERILGLDLLRGRKAGGAVASASRLRNGAALEQDDPSPSHSERSDDEPSSEPSKGGLPGRVETSVMTPRGRPDGDEEVPSDTETEGLPLFGGGTGDPRSE